MVLPARTLLFNYVSFALLARSALPTAGAWSDGMLPMFAFVASPSDKTSMDAHVDGWQTGDGSESCLFVPAIRIVGWLKLKIRIHKEYFLATLNLHRQWIPPMCEFQA